MHGICQARTKLGLALNQLAATNCLQSKQAFGPSKITESGHRLVLQIST